MKSIYSYVIPSVGASTSLSSLTDTNINNPQNNQVLKYQNGFWINSAQSGLTSIGLSMPNIFSVPNSPLTSNGTLNVSFNTQTAHKILAGSLSNDGTVVFRNLDKTDLPAITLDDLSDVVITNPQIDNIIKYNGSNWINTALSLGTVTSVGLSMPSIFSVANTPITTANTFNVTFNSQTSHKFLAGSLANDGTVNFRTIDTTDIPTLSYLTSFNSRTGPAILPASGDYSLNLLGDVSISSPTGAQVLKYNSISGKWENNNDTGLTSVGLSMPSVFSVSNSPLTTNGSIAVSFNSQTSHKFLAGSLTNDGTVNFRTIDTTDIPTLAYLTSFNGRTTAAVIPTKSDYSLNLLADVTISSALSQQVLKYNGTNFVNSFLLDNTYTVDTSVNSNATVSAVNNTTYVCNLGTLNIGNSSSGACIKIINSGASLTINFSGLVYINGTNYFATSFTSSELMYMEIKNYFNGTAWIVSNLSPRIFYPITGKYIYYSISNLDDLRNINIISPTNGQVLKYNSTTSKWENNSDTGLTSIGLSMPSVFSVSNSPLTTNGSIAVSFTAQTSHKFLAGSLANDGTVNFRTIDTTDIPTLSYLTSFNTRTGPAILPASGDYSINQITNASTLANSANVTITTPVNAEILTYNGSVWVNSKRVDSFQFNSDGNLANNNFLYLGYGQQAAENRTQVLLPYNIVLNEININLSVAPGTGNSRIFTIRLNGNIQATVTISNTATTLTQTISVPCTAGQLFSIQHTAVGAAAALGILNIKYYYN